jgi:hypothetical protein
MDSTVPRRKCTEAASTISDLFDMYRNLYTLRRSVVLFGHMALSASQIHLLSLPRPSADHYFTECIRHFCEMGINHPFALRGLRIIIKVASQWGTRLPFEAKRLAAAQVYSPTVPTISPSLSGSFSSQHSQDPAAGMIPLQRVSEALPTPHLPEFFFSPFLNQSIPSQVSSDMIGIDFEAMLSTGSTEWDQYGQDRYSLTNENTQVLSPPRQHYWRPG